jgi:hypothetical protein
MKSSTKLCSRCGKNVLILLNPDSNKWFYDGHWGKTNEQCGESYRNIALVSLADCQKKLDELIAMLEEGE